MASSKTEENLQSRVEPVELEFDQVDLIIRGGKIYDGTGLEPYNADIAVNGQKIVKIGTFENISASKEIDASGLCVAPGFINMLSWANTSLIEDGRSLGGLHQGVTLEVMGEGWSFGPIKEEMKDEVKNMFGGDIQYDIVWNTLGEYLQYLEGKGISTNVASFVGATTLRIYAIGHEDREATETELEIMTQLVDQAMREGAMGVGSSLIYAPAFYSTTDELVELCKVASKYDGMYITHMRSEGNAIESAINEVIEISKRSGIRSEIYHLKQAGKSNWHKLPRVIEMINIARDGGIELTTDMYLYTAAGTGLHATMPPWVLDGGQEEMISKLKDPQIRDRLKKEMNADSDEWENLYLEAGPEKIMIASITKDELKPLIGKRVSEVAEIRNTSPEDTIFDLIVEDEGWIGCIYFIMNEDNLREQIKLPYMSFGSDAASMAPEGVFLKSNTHPRAYGNVSRLLGKYVREEKLISLEEAIRKLTMLPAENLRLNGRGQIKEDYFADIVMFDFDKVNDLATFEDPHQLSEGMVHIVVNGTLVMEDGQHANVFPGVFVKGPGYQL